MADAKCQMKIQWLKLFNTNFTARTVYGNFTRGRSYHKEGLLAMQRGYPSSFINYIGVLKTVNYKYFCKSFIIPRVYCFH